MRSMPQQWRCICARARVRERETERERAKVPRSSAPVERKRIFVFGRRPRSLVWLANTHSLDTLIVCICVSECVWNSPCLGLVVVRDLRGVRIMLGAHRVGATSVPPVSLRRSCVEGAVAGIFVVVFGNVP
jgi:hypothetical protein